jgi:carbamoyl-phosphate synthase large subunit
MEIVYDEASLSEFITKAAEINPEHPVLIDRFLDRATEIDVDAIFDGVEVYLAGVMEHIEEAGVHSGDSACVIPPQSLDQALVERIFEATEKLARAIGVQGLINIQFASVDGELFVLEANPRASRTVPFVSKATGIQLAKAAALVAVGQKISELRIGGLLPEDNMGLANGIAVKEAVLPWNRFRRADGRGVDSILGPEMKSTGEVMGISSDFGLSFAKSQIAAFGPLPLQGSVFISLADKDKEYALSSARRLVQDGFTLYATTGTAEFLSNHGISTSRVSKYSERETSSGITSVDLIQSGEISLVINTPYGRDTRNDGWLIRSAAVARGIPCITTIPGLKAAVEGINSLKRGEISVKSLQEWNAQ